MMQLLNLHCNQNGEEKREEGKWQTLPLQYCRRCHGSRGGGGQLGAGEDEEASGGCREARRDGIKVAALVCEAAGGTHVR